MSDTTDLAKGQNQRLRRRTQRRADPAGRHSLGRAHASRQEGRRQNHLATGTDRRQPPTDTPTSQPGSQDCLRNRPSLWPH